jgi:ABC-type multidrug transport system fused ATPase/permease subunit
VKVRELLKKFRLDKTIEDTEVHQMEFSGGEVQKIELMESILREADILIVDEGTSNIDYNSEKIVLNELFEKYRDKIIIFIAHRLSSITDFERIAVIDKGTVVEEGTHLQLVKKQGKYHFLWGMQKETHE